MNTELIERIALEVAKEMCTYCSMEDARGKDRVFYEFSPDEMPEFLTICLARIDAERGKEAAFWTRRLFGEDREFCEDPFTTDWTPLFLSPTIHEGMALVPVEPTKAMLEAALADPIWYEINPPPHICYKAMLAAAQGERNAD